jgi:hypothetical protein
MNQNKIDSMEAVGELPDLGNLLLREGGFPHLPNPRFVPEPKKKYIRIEGNNGCYDCVGKDDRDLCHKLPSCVEHATLFI